MQVLSVSAPGLEWNFNAAAAKRLSRTQMSRDWFLVADPSKDAVEPTVLDGSHGQELSVRGNFTTASSRLEIRLNIEGRETALRAIKLQIDGSGVNGATTAGIRRLDRLISRCTIICREKGQAVQVLCRLPIDVVRNEADGAFELRLSRSARTAIGEFIGSGSGGTEPRNLLVALHFRQGDVALTIGAPTLVFSSIDLAAARAAGKLIPAEPVVSSVPGKPSKAASGKGPAAPVSAPSIILTHATDALEPSPSVVVTTLEDANDASRGLADRVDAVADDDVPDGAGTPANGSSEAVLGELLLVGAEAVDGSFSSGSAEEPLAGPVEGEAEQADAVGGMTAEDGLAVADGVSTALSQEQALEPPPVTGAETETAAASPEANPPASAPGGAWYRAESGGIIGWVAVAGGNDEEAVVELVANTGRVLAVAIAQPVSDAHQPEGSVNRRSFDFDASVFRRHRRHPLEVRFKGGDRLVENTPETQKEAELPKFVAILEIATEFRRPDSGDDAPRLTKQQGALLAKLFGGVAYEAPQVRQTAAEFLSSILKQPEVRAALLDPLQYGLGPLPHYRHSVPPTRAELQQVVDIIQPGETTSAALLQQRTWTGALRVLFADIEFWRSAVDPSDIDDLFLYDRVRQYWAGENSGPRRCFYQAVGRAVSVPVLAADGFEADGAVDVEIYDRFLQPIVARRGGLQGELLAVPEASEAMPALLAMRRSGATGKGDEWRVFEVVDDGTAVPASAEAVHQSADVAVTQLLVKGVIVEATCLAPDRSTQLRFVMAEGVVRLDALGDVPAGATLASGAVAQRYVGILPVPLTRPVFLAGSRAVGASDWYDIRIGDEEDAPRPSGLPETLVPAAAQTPLFGAIALDGGHVVGWVVDPQNVRLPLRVRLVAVANQVDGGLDDSIGEVEPPIVVSMRANNRSAAAADLFGGDFGKCGFRLALPPALFDGREYTLSLEALADAEQRVFWSTSFRADQSFIFGQIVGIADSQQMQHFLVRVGCAGRADVLSELYGNKHALLPVDLTEIQHFEIIASLFANFPAGRRVPVLSSLFDSLWAHAMTSNQRLNEFVSVARSATLAAQPGRIRIRFPESPLTEAAVDLIFASERAGDDNADLMLRRAADAVAANRLQLAASYLERAREKHREHPAIQVLAGRVALAMGDLAAAKQAAAAALSAKPGLREAETVLAQVLSREGRGLEAAAVLGRGDGVASAIGKPIGYDRALTTMQLDWVQTLTEAATADAKVTLIDLLSRAKEIYKDSEPPVQADFSLAFTRGVKLRRSVHDAFLQAGPACRQVSVLEQDDVTTAISLGRWTFVLQEDLAITPQIAERILAERRPFELIVKLMGVIKEPQVAGVSLKIIGLVVRSDILRSFMPSSFSEFLQSAEQRLKIKTIIV